MTTATNYSQETTLGTFTIKNETFTPVSYTHL